MARGIAFSSTSRSSTTPAAGTHPIPLRHALARGAQKLARLSCSTPDRRRTRTLSRCDGQGGQHRELHPPPARSGTCWIFAKPPSIAKRRDSGRRTHDNAPDPVPLTHARRSPRYRAHHPPPRDSAKSVVDATYRPRLSVFAATLDISEAIQQSPITNTPSPDLGN